MRSRKRNSGERESTALETESVTWAREKERERNHCMRNLKRETGSRGRAREYCLYKSGGQTWPMPRESKSVFAP